MRLRISWHKYLGNIVMRYVRLCYTTIYKLTAVYTNGTRHEYVQEYIPLAYYNINTWHVMFKCVYEYLGNNVMRCTSMLHYGLQVDCSAHKWHSSWVCSRIYSSCILQHKHVTRDVQMRLRVSWQQCYEVYVYVTLRSTSWLQCTQMALVMSLFKNILFLLHTTTQTRDTCHLVCSNNISPYHTETQNYHLEYPNVQR